MYKRITVHLKTKTIEKSNLNIGKYNESKFEFQKFNLQTEHRKELNLKIKHIERSNLNTKKYKEIESRYYLVLGNTRGSGTQQTRILSSICEY